METELIRAAKPVDVSPSSQAWFTDKLNQALDEYDQLKEVLEGATLDYGYANGWREDPKLVKDCKAKGHKPKEQSDRAFGFTHTVWCDICRYKYKYDSS